MRLKNIKRQIIILCITILILIGYRGYLLFHEGDFTASNYKNIETIKSLTDNGNYSFAVFGSAKNSIDVFQDKVIESINDDPSLLFSISTGDSVLDGSEDKYRILNNALKKTNIPVVVGVGDAEVSDNGDGRFYRHFGPFYTSFSFRDSYFIFFDSTGTTSWEMQKDWLGHELEKGSLYKHIFVIMNNTPIYERSSSFKNQENYGVLTELFSKYHVSAVFSNGTELLKETEFKGVKYYSSGGAGGLILKEKITGNYHYLKVNVTEQNFVVAQIEVGKGSHLPVTKVLLSIWIYVHSLFYAQLWNILMVLLFLVVLSAFYFYRSSKETNYYKNFTNLEHTEIYRSNLRIAMFTNNYLPFVGGVPISIHRLAGALRDRGHYVEIFAPKYKGFDEIESDVFRCKTLFFRKTDKFTYAIANVFSTAIDKEFQKGNFDIVHVHHPFLLGKKGLTLGKMQNLPIIFTYHTRLELYAHYLPFFKLAFKNIVSHRLIRNFSQSSSGIISPTSSAKEYLENIGVGRQKLILPTGLNLSKYEGILPEEIDDIRNKYLKDDELLLCSVSRLSEEKNLFFLLNGIKYIYERTTVPFKCILIGDGPEKEELKARIIELELESCVILIGTVAQSQISKYYLASDIFVFSSLSETQGMVLLEAMAGKCPVVCLRSSGTDDVIEEGNNGYITSIDTKEWGDAVIRLIEDNALLASMRENAYNYAKEYSIEKMAEKVEIFYNKLINEIHNNT